MGAPPQHRPETAVDASQHLVEAHIETLRALEASGDQDLLRSAADESRRLFPASAEIASIAFKAALDAGDHAAAAALLCDFVWPLESDPSTRRRHVEMWLDASASDDLLETTLLQLLEATPDDQAALVAVAALDLRRQRPNGALRRLERAEAQGPLWDAAARLRIDALIACKEWDDAALRALEGALRASPDLRILHALKQNVHEQRGETHLGAEALREARARFPADPWFALRAFRRDLDVGRFTDAARLLADLIWGSSLPEATRRAALATLTRDWKQPEELEPFLHGLLRGGPDDRFVLVKLAVLSTHARRHVEAARHLARAKQYGPLPREAESMQVNLLVLEGDAEGSLALAKKLLAKRPDRKDLVRRVNILASICGRQDDVTATMAHAIERWPTDAAIVQRFNRTVIPEAEDQRLFERLVAISEDAPADARWRYQFSLACLRRRDTPRACATLRGLVDDPLVSMESRRLLGVLETAPAEWWDACARFTNDATKDVRIIEKASARATFVVLAGVHGGLGNLPLSHLDALLKDHPINVIYLRDNRWSAFTSGVVGLGPDEASSIAALRDICAGLGSAPVVTFGGSLAGWSAMRYGALMGARLAISLSGPVSLTPREGGPTRFTQQYLAKMMPTTADNLLDLLTASPMRVVHVHGGENERDLANAQRLASLGNVTLAPLAGCADHFVAAHIVARGEFHPLIERALAMVED